MLKKEVANSSSPSETEEKDVSKYRQSLVKTLHACSLQFSSVAPIVVPLVSMKTEFRSLSCIIDLVAGFLDQW